MQAKPFFHSIKWPLFELILSLHTQGIYQIRIECINLELCRYFFHPWTMQNAYEFISQTRSCKLITATSIGDEDSAQKNWTIHAFF